MNKIIFLILQSVLQLASSTSLRVIKPNVLALEVKDLSSSQVSLHCGEQDELEDIHWERNGESIPERGNHITVTIDGLRGGNFTCHKPNGELLNYTLLLVHPVLFPRGGILTRICNLYCKELQRTFSLLLEMAPGTLRKSRCVFFSNPNTKEGILKKVGSRIAPAPLHFYRMVTKPMQVNGDHSSKYLLFDSAVERKSFRFEMTRGNSSVLNCTVDADISGVTCIDMDYCPYSEESRSINLTLLVRNLYRLEEHHRSFLISDIVQPDKVTINKIKDDVFEWHPPETWSFPCSFFPLSYEVKVIPNNHNCNFTGNRVDQHETNETHYTVNTRKSYIFCVRAQDPFTTRAWSDWSHLHQKKHRHRSDQ